MREGVGKAFLIYITVFFYFQLNHHQSSRIHVFHHHVGLMPNAETLAIIHLVRAFPHLSVVHQTVDQNV